MHQDGDAYVYLLLLHFSLYSQATGSMTERKAMAYIIMSMELAMKAIGRTTNK